ncbi:MAG: hypothetical protein IPM34_01170 [Saprospiraceae bacterium]|nr:hypothetical protein [Saprospiraceae bacterium]
MFLIRFFIISILVGCFSDMNAQCPLDSSKLELKAEYFDNPAFGNFLSLRKDRLGRDLLFTTTKDAGLKIFRIENGNLNLHKQFAPSVFGGGDVISLQQQGEYLYLTLGDIWNTNENVGLAILDVSDESSMVVTDTINFPSMAGGAADVFIQNDTAYLAAMRNGIVLLDVRDKKNIQFISQLTFGNDFPHRDSSNSDAYNARGIWVKDNYAYVCYDRGGLRVVDLADPVHPKEVAKYCFQNLVNYATAYNHIWIHQNLAFVAIDYYGMEILDISDPLHIRHKAHWHPQDWAPATNDFPTWAGSKGHANEIAYDEHCNSVFLSAGKTDVAIIDVNDSNNPVTCGLIGNAADTYGTWGIDYFSRHVYASYIWSPFFPPHSNYTGFRAFEIPDCVTTTVKPYEDHDARVVFIYSKEKGTINFKFRDPTQALKIKIFSLSGLELFADEYSNLNELQVNEKFQAGFYLIQMQFENKPEKNYKFILPE